MRKFIAFSKAVWQQTLSYRAESLLWFLIEALPLVYMISLWLTLERAGRISAEQSGRLVFYYVISLTISRFTGSHFEEWLIDDIKDGNFNKYFVKPFSPKIFLLASDLVWKLSGMVFLLPTLTLLYPFLSKLKGIVIIPSQVVAAVLILLIANFQRFLVSWLIALTAFWFQQSKSLTHLKWMLEGLFGGAWLPLYFFPGWFFAIARWTPFYSWYYLPIQLINNQVVQSELIRATVVATAWLIGLFLIGDVVWKRAILRYSAVGG